MVTSDRQRCAAVPCGQFRVLGQFLFHATRHGQGVAECRIADQCQRGVGVKEGLFAQLCRRRQNPVQHQTRNGLIRAAKPPPPDHMWPALHHGQIPVTHIVHDRITHGYRRDRIGVAVQDHRRVVAPGKRFGPRNLAPFRPISADQTFREIGPDQPGIGRRIGPRIRQNALRIWGFAFGIIGTGDGVIGRPEPAWIGHAQPGFRVDIKVGIGEAQHGHHVAAMRRGQSPQERHPPVGAIQRVERIGFQQGSRHHAFVGLTCGKREIYRDWGLSQLPGQSVIGRFGRHLHIGRASGCRGATREHARQNMFRCPAVTFVISPEPKVQVDHAIKDHAADRIGKGGCVLLGNLSAIAFAIDPDLWRPDRLTELFQIPDRLFGIHHGQKCRVRQ